MFSNIMRCICNHTHVQEVNKIFNQKDHIKKIEGIAINKEDAMPEVPMVELVNNKQNPVKKDIVIHVAPFQERVAGGVILGAASGIGMRPIDNYLILLQGGKKSGSRALSSKDVVTTLYERGIVKGWFRGILSATMKAGIGNISQFVAKSFFEERIQNCFTDNKVASEALSGLAGGVAQTLVTNPLSTIEARLAVDPNAKTVRLIQNAFTGEVSKVKNVQNGMTFFYRGTFPAMLRNATWLSAFYPIRHTMHEMGVHLKEAQLMKEGVDPRDMRPEQLALSSTERAAIGAGAGVMATMISLPPEVISKVQKTQNVSTLGAIKKILQPEGKPFSIRNAANFWNGYRVAGVRMLIMGICITKADEWARAIMHKVNES